MPSRPSDHEYVPTLTRRRTLTIKEVGEGLDVLTDHGFIKGWGRNGRYWTVNAPGDEGYLYTRTQISAWLEGAAAMGAG